MKVEKSLSFKSSKRIEPAEPKGLASSWQLSSIEDPNQNLSLPRDVASPAAQGTSPSAPRRKREPKGRPTSGCSEQVLFPIFTVLRAHKGLVPRGRGVAKSGRRTEGGRVGLTLRG